MVCKESTFIHKRGNFLHTLSKYTAYKVGLIMLLQFDCLLLEVEKAAQSVMSVCMERIVMFVYYTSVSTKAGVGDRS